MAAERVGQGEESEARPIPEVVESQYAAEVIHKEHKELALVAHILLIPHLVVLLT